jgi:hypothetical protein
MGSPAGYPLTYHCETPDVVVVHITRRPTHDRDGGAAGGEDRL